MNAADLAIWKWRYTDYTDEELSEVYRRGTPGSEDPSHIAAMELLAERAVRKTQGILGEPS
jgi:hypothetical protein